MPAMRKPSGVSVRISTANHAKLQEWTDNDQRSIGEIVNDLIEAMIASGSGIKPMSNSPG